MIKEKDCIIGLLKVLHPSIKIYLFGSYARGTQTRGSDIDLAVDTGSPLSIGELARMRNVIEALNIPQTVDVVDMQSIPQELKQVILTEGVLWID